MESIDYTKLSKSRMTDQFRFDEAFLALMDTLITHRSLRQAQYQEFAEVFLDIDKSKGKALDAIGKVVGQERRLVNFIQQPYFGFKGARFAEAYDVGYWYSMNKARLGTLKVVNDDQYRRLLKARIINNRSRCTRNDLLSILNILTGNNQSMIYEVSHGVFQVSVAEGDEGLASYFLSRYREPNTMFSIPLGYRMTIRYKEVIPPISCDGATNKVVVQFGGWVNSTPTDQWLFTIKDLTTNEVYVQFTNNQFDQDLTWSQVCEQLKTSSCPFDFMPSSDPVLDVMNLKSGVTSPVRVRIDAQRLPTATDTDVIEFYIVSGNPAYTTVSQVQDNYVYDICFDPEGGNQISCDGAVSSVEMAFAIKDGETPTLDVIFLVDNEMVDLMNNPPPYITREVLNKVYDGSVPAGFSTGNGVLKFTNTDSVPHRIEAFTNNFQNIRIVANHNPTVIELDNEFIGADVGVCLSANV